MAGWIVVLLCSFADLKILFLITFREELGNHQGDH